MRNEVEALFLEFNLIKEHRPRFNIRLKDDKSYPFLAVTLDEEWPRAMVMRGKKRKGVRYFGPYAHAYAIRETLDLLLRTFPIRTCTNNKFHRHQRLGRPCLYAHIEKCVGAVRAATSTTTSTSTLVDELLVFLDGEHDAGRRPAREADARGGRRARVRARGPAARPARARCARPSSASRWSAPSEEDFDLIGIAEDELEASVQVFYVRRGRVVGPQGPRSSTRSRTSTTPALVARILEQLYGDADRRRRARRRSSSRSSPRTSDLYEEFLSLNRGSPRCASGCRSAARSARCSRPSTLQRAGGVQPPQAASARRTTTPAPARSLALQEALDLPEAPLRIECFDISNLQGTEIVASMVVMEDGLPKRSDYRRFKVKTTTARTTSPRWRRCSPAGSAATSRERDEGAHAGKRFAYPPNLLVIDGGKGQLNVAVRVLEELGLEDICVVGLAKRFEEVYLPGRSRTRCASRATPRRCTCSSRCATRPTGSRSRTTGSCATRR